VKKNFFSLIVLLLALACAQSAKPEDEHHPSGSIPVSKEVGLSGLLALSDAEKILGEPASLSDSSTKRNTDVLRYQCAYKANAEDPKTKKLGNLYFLAEAYDQVSGAQKKYTDIKKANAGHKGVKTLEGLGDEAYFHSDDENFYFIMVRKGNNVITLKVNRITSKTSLEEFNAVAKKITESIQ